VALKWNSGRCIAEFETRNRSQAGAQDLARENTAAGSSLDRLGTLSLPKRLPLQEDKDEGQLRLFLNVGPRCPDLWFCSVSVLVGEAPSPATYALVANLRKILKLDEAILEPQNSTCVV
jgi:hypothetical protein